MISEASCDTEDWSNDAEDSALHHRNKLHFKIYSHGKVILNCKNISQYFVLQKIEPNANSSMVAYANITFWEGI